MLPVEIEVIKKIRNEIPIGITEAIRILILHDSEVVPAIEYWRTEQLENFCEATNTEKSIARNFLKKHKWDLKSSVNEYKSSKLTFTERILQSSTIEETIINRVERAIREENKWLDKDDFAFWNFKKLSQLKKYQYEFIVITDWLHYAEWEGFDYAIKVEHLETIIEILYQIDAKDFIEALSKYMRNPDKPGENQIRRQRKDLSRKIVKFVRRHKFEFPK